MTGLRVMSDLHLEFGPLDLAPIGEDVLVLAGDVGIHTDGAEWALAYARRTGVPVVMIAGNHEFYRNPTHRDHTVRSTLDSLRSVADASGGFLTFLEDDMATVGGITFVGCTLWTNFRLYGDQQLAMLWAQRRMNDFRVIMDREDYWFRPEDALRRHESSVGRLRAGLPRNDAIPLVVVTHHLPSRRSVAARYEDDPINAAFASDLDYLVELSGASLWVHGHTHDSHDYRIGGARVLCNPRGYAPHEVNPAFDPRLVVEV